MLRMTNKSPDTKLCEEAIRMEHRKSMPYLTYGCQGYQSLAFLSNHSSQNSLGWCQPAKCILHHDRSIVSRAAVRGGPGGPFPRSEVTQRARRPLMSTVAGQRAITSVFQMRKHDSGASPLCTGGCLEVGLTAPLEPSLGNEGQSLGGTSRKRGA